MYYLEIGLLFAGLALLLPGYRRTHRNLMLAGAILLFLSGTVADLARGYAEGFAQTRH